MIDYDDLIDDLHESAAQSYDELSQATIDVLNRAVDAINTLRHGGAGVLRETADRIDEFYPLDMWPDVRGEHTAALHDFARSLGMADGSPFHVAGIRHALKQVRQRATELERESVGTDD